MPGEVSKSDMLLKIDGLRKTSRVPWPILAEIYEAETGEKVEPEKLRKRVSSAVHRRMLKMRAEARDALAELLESMPREERPGFRTRLRRWLKSLFQRKLGSRDEEHWVNHICDEFCPPPSPAIAWANLHGFDEGPGATYWVGLDCRNFGIRSADYVIRCRTRALYDKYVEIAGRDGSSAFLQAALHDPALDVRRGGDVNVKFIFRWGDDDKSFNVRLAGDLYAEER